jgi:hypothetical protein
MKVKNLTVVRLTEWHEKAASSKLTVVYDYNTLEHMVEEPSDIRSKVPTSLLRAQTM